MENWFHTFHTPLHIGYNSLVQYSRQQMNCDLPLELGATAVLARD